MNRSSFPFQVHALQWTLPFDQWLPSYQGEGQSFRQFPWHRCSLLTNTNRCAQINSKTKARENGNTSNPAMTSSIWLSRLLPRMGHFERFLALSQYLSSVRGYFAFWTVDLRKDSDCQVADCGFVHQQSCTVIGSERRLCRHTVRLCWLDSFTVVDATQLSSRLDSDTHQKPKNEEIVFHPLWCFHSSVLFWSWVR